MVATKLAKRAKETETGRCAMSTGEEEPTRADPQLEAASTGATAATAASQCPQPPYDEDFNPFSEEGRLFIYS